MLHMFPRPLIIFQNIRQIRKYKYIVNSETGVQSQDLLGLDRT